MKFALLPLRLFFLAQRQDLENQNIAEVEEPLISETQIKMQYPRFENISFRIIEQYCQKILQNLVLPISNPLDSGVLGGHYVY